MQETNQKKQGIKQPVWNRRLGTDKWCICFASSFKLDSERDLSEFARSLPEGVVLCDPGMIAGLQHVETVLLQTREYWKRGQKLVRNGSIEILMRLVCRSQISEAVEASGIKRSSSVAILGLVSNQSEVENQIENFSSIYGSGKQDISLIEMNRQKRTRLKKFHKLPGSFSDDQVRVALQEMSVLLNFSK